MEFLGELVQRRVCSKRQSRRHLDLFGNVEVGKSVEVLVFVSQSMACEVGACIVWRMES